MNMKRYLTSPVFNQAYIIVIPKAGKGHIQCANYCPISMINVDTSV